MRVLLVSTYELGHQPLHVASPAAALRKAGHEVRCLDLSVERWDAGALEWAQAAGFSVPMHTAMRLAMRAAAGVRRARPELPVCFYGLYAPVSRDLTCGALADRAIAGEYEPALTAWVGELAAGGLGFLGVAIDPRLNLAAAGDAEISSPDASVRTLVISAREDLEIARSVRRVLRGEA